MKAYVLIEVRPGEIAKVVKHLQRVEGVTEATMTFGPYDAIAIVNAETVKAVGQVVYDRIQPIPGVLDTLTCLAIEPD
jgi:DNA-binding Lrp family transcriptional regulator